MKIVICDDEELFIVQLEKLIKEYFRKSKLPCPNISTFNSGEAFLNSGEPADIVFLDVEMSGKSGIYVGDEIKKRNPRVIVFIVTSYLEYLDEAMKVNVFRYLTKPIDKERLYRNIKDALILYNSSVEKFVLETKEETRIMQMTDIIFVEINNNKVKIHTEDKVYKSVQTMKYWEETLNRGCFFRCHRSYIVNMEYVSGFEPGVIYMNVGNQSVYMARRKYKQFKDAYMLFLESMN